MRFSIGITIHNEERNIGQLLEALRREPLGPLGLERVIVVSSGSTDRSEAIVHEIAASWDRIDLVVEAERRGKASAINRFLESARDVDILLLMSGDVVPAPGAIALILDAFRDPGVGMAGGRPVPRGAARNLVERVVRLQWDLHHEVSLHHPKLGEVVAFRNVIESIPEDTAVDEAAIEAIFRDRGARFAYVGDAVIWNKGPENVADFLRQRRRIAAGHHHLSKTQRYQVSTSKNGFVARVALRALIRTPSRWGVAVVTALLEAWGRALGLYDLLVKGKNPYIWDVAKSTKDLASVSGEPPRGRG